jgi:hypothetical protein
VGREAAATTALLKTEEELVSSSVRKELEIGGQEPEGRHIHIFQAGEPRG